MIDYPFLCRKSTGKLWPAGRSGLGLCSAWNHATNPSIFMTEREHARSIKYARAIMNRIRRQGIPYLELSDGTLWPRRYHP